MEIKSAALIGVGAVGSYFAYGLPAKLGDRFCVIASGKRKERLEKEGIYINGERCPLNLKTAQEAGKVDLVLVATKQTALPEIMDDICALVGENTIVLSLLNGVTSEEIIGNEIGMEHMLYSLMRIDAVRDGNHLIPTLALEQHAHRAGVQVPPVADGFAPAVAFQRRAHNGGLMLVEQPHRVEGVRDAARAAADGFHARFVIRAGMADGDRHVVADPADHIHHAGHFGRHGDVADHAGKLVLVRAQQVFVAFAQQVLRHRALVFLREERPFQVRAQKLRAFAAVAHDVCNRAEALFGRLLRIGQHACVECGHALRREERRDFAQTRFVRRVHVHARRAVRVHVDKARRKAHAARVDDVRFVVGQVFADLCNQRIFAKHICPRELSVLIDARVFDQELIHPRFSFQRKVR